MVVYTEGMSQKEWEAQLAADEAQRLKKLAEEADCVLGRVLAEQRANGRERNYSQSGIDALTGSKGMYVGHDAVQRAVKRGELEKFRHPVDKKITLYKLNLHYHSTETDGK